jgi:antitoxin HigA-1
MNVPRPVHPGEILREDFLVDYALTAGALAKAIGVPRDRMEKIIREKRAVTAETAARLARYFNTSAQFWLNLQANFDLAHIDSETLTNIVPLRPEDFAQETVSLGGFQETPADPFTEFSEWAGEADNAAYRGLSSEKTSKR